MTTAEQVTTAVQTELQTEATTNLATTTYDSSIDISVENRSRNQESIIGRDFDLIIDLKSILGQIYQVLCPLTSGAISEAKYIKNISQNCNGTIIVP